MTEPQLTKQDNTVINAPTVQTGTWRVDRDLTFTAISLFIGAVAVLLHYLSELEQLAYVLVFLSLMTSMPYGRLYYTYLVIKPHSRWLRSLPNGVLWQYNSRSRFRRQPPFPLAAHFVTLRDRETLGLLHNKAGGIDGIVVEGDGWDLAAVGIEEQANMLDALATVHKELAATVKGYSIGIGLRFARRPLNTYATTRMITELLHPDVRAMWRRLVEGNVPPEDELTPDELCDLRVAQNYADLIPTLEANAAEVSMAMVITVYRDSVLAKMQRTKKRKASTKGLTVRDVYGLNVVRLARNAVSKLEGVGIANPRYLDFEDIQDYIRASWDGTQINEYYMGPFGSLDYLQPETQNDPHAIPPMYPHEHIVLRREPDNGQLQLIYDGTYHAVLMLTKNPEWQSPYTFRSLYSLKRSPDSEKPDSNPFYTVTLAGTTLRSSRDVDVMEFGTKVVDSLREIRGVTRLSRRAKRRDAERETRADRIDDSQYVMRHNEFVHLMGSSSDELEDRVQREIDMAEGANLAPERVNEESVIQAAVLTAATGFDLL